jgi:hypothetical protein
MKSEGKERSSKRPWVKASKKIRRGGKGIDKERVHFKRVTWDVIPECSSIFLYFWKKLTNY